MFGQGNLFLKCSISSNEGQKSRITCWNMLFLVKAAAGMQVKFSKNPKELHK